MDLSGLSPTTLAEKCKPTVTRSYIANIVAGRRQPTAEMTLRLAAALGVPVAAILADPNEAIAS